MWYDGGVATTSDQAHHHLYVSEQTKIQSIRISVADAFTLETNLRTPFSFWSTYLYFHRTVHVYSHLTNRSFLCASWS
ncbi:MAG: hypothetical protein EBR20_11670 [Bacteroidetes bacterium]|nr:hypothetical protein [Bacteroidota bacterium]